MQQEEPNESRHQEEISRRVGSGLFAFTMDTAHHIRYRDTLHSRYGEILSPECPEEEGVNEFLQMADDEEE